MQETGVGPDPGAATGTSRWQKLVGILGIAVVAWVGSELYDVVFFDGTFGGGGHTPVQDQDLETDTDTDTDVGGHTPPPGGHG